MFNIHQTFKDIYKRLVGIDDSPHRIASGAAVGVFCGIFPGVGPLAALAVAWVFGFNRLAAFTGGLLTNTWLSVVTFVLSIKAGAKIVGVDWHMVYEQCKDVFKNFSFQKLQELPFKEILLPVLLGYLSIALATACLAYAAVYFAIKRRHTKTHAS